MTAADLGAFRLVRPLAEGGVAQVWAAEHVATSVPVAVKVITGERARDPYFRASFNNEVRAVAALDHPGIVRVLDHGEVGPEGAGPLAAGCPYLVMELARAGTLRSAEQRALAWPEIRTILLALLSALAHAHARGVIHRDLKPGNVLVCGRDDPRPGLKITDFGLARLLEEHDRPGTVEAVRGTLHYLSPEQARGLWRDQGPWTDLYALGCMAWQLATGRPPFRAFEGEALLRAHVEEPVPALPPRRGLPAGFEAWVGTLLRKRPWDRPQRAADAAWALSLLPAPDDVGPTRWIFGELAAAHGLTGEVDTDPGPRTPLPDDVDPSEDATVRVPALDGGSVPLAARPAPHAAALPPIPRTWREPQAPATDLRLVDAGLSMLGLRTLGVVGRHAERDALWDALLRAGAGPQAVALRGPKGSGISRLSSWFGSRAHEVGAAHIFLLTHRPGESRLLAVRRALVRAVGTAGLDDDAVSRRVRSFVQRHDLPDLLPTLAAALGSELPLAISSAAPLSAALLRILCRFAEERPVLLRIEDLHRCPESASLALDILASSYPIVVVSTRRHDGLDEDLHPLIRRFESDPRAVALAPGPLSHGEMRALLRGQLRLAADVSLRVEQISQGNPQLAVQLALGWAERGLLEPTPDGFALPPGTPIDLPDDLHAIWAQRVDGVLQRLPGAARFDLERAAVLGERFAPHAWHAACPPERRSDRERLVEALLDARLLVRDGADLALTHPMLRESLLRDAREADRLRGHHAACARAVADLPGGGWRAARRLGLHLHAAGDPAKARDPLVRAAEGAAADGDHRASLALATLACEGGGLSTRLGRRAALLRLQGLAAAGDFAESDALEPALRDIADVLPDPRERADVLLALARHMVLRERPELADERLVAARRALAEGVDIDAPLAHRLALVAAHVARMRGDAASATASFAEAIQAARLAGDQTGEAIALRSLGALRWHGGDPAGAEAAYRAALDLLHDGPTVERATILNNLGECARGSGDLDGAEACYAEAAALLERSGAAAFPFPLLNLGIVRVRSGRHHEALEPLARALEEWERQRNVDLASATRVVLLPCCAALGDWPGWARQIDQLDRAGLPSEIEPELGRALRAAADIALQAARPAEARRGFALAAAVLELAGCPGEAAGCRAREAELATLG